MSGKTFFVYLGWFKDVFVSAISICLYIALLRLSRWRILPLDDDALKENISAIVPLPAASACSVCESASVGIAYLLSTHVHYVARH